MTPKKPGKGVKPVKAWAIQHKISMDLANKIFVTRLDAINALCGLPLSNYNIIRVEIRPLPRKTRKG